MSKAAYWAWLDGAKVQGIALHDLVEQYGSPLYVYDGNEIRARLLAYQQAALQAKIHYAVKANSNLSLLAKMAQWGRRFRYCVIGRIAAGTNGRR
ncbi:Diaminopimelate decarboxylase [Brevundimonas vesicularis]|uniref:Diaminopimelate decarboxylase n=1 Tax=Brevundimonas vesicularis TaxID=41276 RepID=A0A2X1BEE1_BREVE|nr:Diaminopimelate decarboxylase [Brevundimonas vesicularis]